MIINENKKNDVTFISLDNNNGMRLTLSTFGASIYQLETKDKDNKMESVILTPQDLNDFYYSTGYFGKCVGRFSGRIDNAKCSINDKEYTLDINWNNVNSLHGGNDGISFKNFDYEIKDNDSYVDVIFTYLEKENKLPGDVSYTFTYRVEKNENEFTLFFNATTTKDTLVNLTNHVYFNLSGNGKVDMTNQQMQLLCNTYTKLNNNLITEKIEPVNKVMDFTNMHKIGDYINDPSLRNHQANGYDHCWIKTNPNDSKIAILQDDVSKRRLTVYTSYPAIVCYAGCYPASFKFLNDLTISQFYSMCVECQYIPNGINMENVDKAILKKNETYNHYIKYHFDIVK